MLTEASPVNEAALSDPEVTLSEEAVQGRKEVAKKLKVVNDRKPKLTFNEEDDTPCDLDPQQ